MARRHCSLAFAFLVAVALFAHQPAWSASDRITVGIPSAILITSAPLALATSAGFLKDENIEMEMLAFDGAATLLPQIATKRVMVGWAAPDALIISNQPGRDRLPLKFFYNVIRASAWEYVVLEDSPIVEMASLRGKTLGVGSLSFGNIPITKAQLKELGIEIGKDVTLLPVGVGINAFRAIKEREVDALNLYDGIGATLELSGTAIRRLPQTQRYLDLFSSSFVAHEETIRDTPDLLARFGRAVTKATIACKENMDACVRQFWQAYPNQRPSGGNEEKNLASAKHVLAARMERLFAFPTGKPPRWGEFPEGSWRNFVDVLYAGGQLKTPDLPIEAMYTNALVDKFNAFDATELSLRAKQMR